MIVTVTLNAALGVFYQAERVTWDTPNQVSGVRHRAEGRGVAVARVLHTFGHEVVAAGLTGGAAGEMIREDLSRRGIPTAFTRIGRESRRVVEVHDAAAGRRMSFAEPGPYITTEELGRFAADYRRLLGGATAVVLCGSLPEGMPAEIYGTLATYAAEAGVPAILDAAGAALRYGAARRPALVIPPTGPAGAADAAGGDGVDAGAAGAGAVKVCGVDGVTGAGGAADVPSLLAWGAEAVALLSGQMVQGVTAEGRWRATLPGAAAAPWPRHALVAGLVPGVLLGWSWPDRLRHAVALGASTSAAGEVDLVAYERLIGRVRVESPTHHARAGPPAGLARAEPPAS